MAVLMMAHNNSSSNNDTHEAKPIFHDFLGMSCASGSPLVVPAKNGGFGGEILPSEASASASASVGVSSGGHGPVSATSDLGSERQMGNHLEGVPFHGSMSDISGPEISNRFPGRKRHNLDSTFMGPTRDRMPQTGPDSLESSQLMKILRNGVGGERPRRSQDEELFFGMQPQRPTSSSSLILQPPIGSRPDSVVSKWERSMLMNASSMVQYPPLVSQFTHFADKASSNRHREANTGPSLISQMAADEGSRTGIKGSGILSSINASSGAPDRNSPVMLASSSRPKSGTHIADPESSNPTSRHGLMSGSQQMTIFYAGQAHVFDDVHPSKADAIMALAGSNGRSWSTTYSPKSNVQLPHIDAYVPNGVNEISQGNLALSQELRGRLSAPGNSIHGFSKGVRISTTQGDPLNLTSGAHQGGAIVRDTRPSVQASEPETRGKREV